MMKLNKFIIYTNYFEYNNRILSYRKKLLFDITDNPIALFKNNNKGFYGYWINGVWLNENKIQDMIINKNYIKQLDKLEDYIIEQLDKVI